MHLFLNASMVLMTDGNLFLSWATFFSSFRDLDLGLNKSKMVTLKGEMDKLIQFVAGEDALTLSSLYAPKAISKQGNPILATIYL